MFIESLLNGSFFFAMTVLAIMVAVCAPRKSNKVLVTSKGRRIVEHWHETFGLLFVGGKAFDLAAGWMAGIAFCIFMMSSCVAENWKNGSNDKWMFALLFACILTGVVAFINEWILRRLFDSIGDVKDELSDRMQRMGNFNGVIGLLAGLAFFVSVVHYIGASWS